ncbi:MAG: hypothetical protein M3Z32_03840 [Acidobacteriota bacterium]|nr:hypothetical protein [Acidobacteriota bacterium]
MELTQLTAGSVNIQYTYTAGANNGKIASQTDVMSGETLSYAYDALNRLISANSTFAGQSQTLGYDGFGNLVSKPPLSVNVDPATNRITSLSYDGNGNVTFQPGMTGLYNYDVENRMTSGAGRAVRLRWAEQAQLHGGGELEWCGHVGGVLLLRSGWDEAGWTVMGTSLVLVITLVGLNSLCGQTGAEHLLTVSGAKTTPSSDNGAPGMKEDVFFVKFKATLLNTSDRAIFISLEPIIPVKAEILLPSGDWKTMATSSSYDTGDQKYLQCTKVEPGKTFIFPNVTDMVVLARDRPPNHPARVRFHFYTVCLTGSATRSTVFVTEPIETNY